MRSGEVRSGAHADVARCCRKALTALPIHCGNQSQEPGHARVYKGVRMPTEINKVAVVGGGYMGGGIAQTLALAGLTCALADVTAEGAENSVRRLVKEGKDYESRGLFPEGAHDLLVANLRAAESIEGAVEGADYVSEAVPEILQLKQSTLGRISKAAGPHTVIGSNTSAIPIG